MTKTLAIAFITTLCNLLHGPDTSEKRNYHTYACIDEINRCSTEYKANDAFVDSEQVSECTAKYVEEHYRRRRE